MLRRADEDADGEAGNANDEDDEEDGLNEADRLTKHGVSSSTTTTTGVQGDRQFRKDSGSYDSYQYEDAEAELPKTRANRRCQCEGRLQTPLYITCALVFIALVATAFIFAPWDQTKTETYAVLRSTEMSWKAITHQQVSFSLSSNSPFPNTGNLVIENFHTRPPTRTTTANTTVRLTNVQIGGGSNLAYPLYLLASPSHASRLTAAFSSPVSLLVFRGTNSYKQWLTSPQTAAPAAQQPSSTLHNLTLPIDQAATYWFVFVNERASNAGNVNGNVHWSQLLQNEYRPYQNSTSLCTPQRDAPCTFDVAWGSDLFVVAQMTSPSGSSGSPIYNLRVHVEARPTFYWLMVVLVLLVLGFAAFFFCVRQRASPTDGLTERSPLVIQQNR